jgi:acetyl-CoA acyltransferase
VLVARPSSSAVLGVGMTIFGRYPERSLKDLSVPAIGDALADAGVAPTEIDMVFVASTVNAVTTDQVAVVGQVVLSGCGIHGVPVFNVENACAGSSSALNLATHAISAGAAHCVLVVGVEKLFSADRALTFRALNGSADAEWARGTGVDLEHDSVFVKEVYAQRLRDYSAHHELSAEILAKIAVKNRAHAALNDKAQYRDPITVEQVLNSRVVQDPITMLMCSPIADGASAAVVIDGDRARSEPRAIWIRASRTSMGSPPPRAEATIGRVARLAYDDADITPAQIDVAEVHDATAFGELLAYEELGLSERGKAADLVLAGDTSLGGRIPVNPSGGLESRGHPLAATGVAQIVELVAQLRGEAGARQVEGAAVGVAETAGGFVNGDSAAVAVTVLASTPARDS